MEVSLARESGGAGGDVPPCPSDSRAALVPVSYYAGCSYLVSCVEGKGGSVPPATWSSPLVLVPSSAQSCPRSADIRQQLDTLCVPAQGSTRTTPPNFCSHSFNMSTTTTTSTTTTRSWQLEKYSRSRGAASPSEPPAKRIKEGGGSDLAPTVLEWDH